MSKKGKRGKGCLFLAVVESFFIFMIYGSAYGGVPSQVRVTNVRGTQFTVSWTSAAAETGQVKYGTSKASHASWALVNDDRGAATSDDIHHVTATGLTQNTTYYYEIISGNTTDDNNGNYYNLNPGPGLLPSDSCLPAGKVFKNQAKTQPAYDSIVYVTILGAAGGENSATESITADSGGYWYLELVNFRTKDYSDPYSYTCGVSRILVEAQGGNDGMAQMTTDAVDYRIAERPALVLEPSEHTVTFTAGAGGSITGTTTQTIPHGGDCTAVKAVPDSGYRFTRWSDGSTANPRTITKVTSNLNLIANFISSEAHLTAKAGDNQTVDEGKTVRLDGSGSTDSNGGIDDIASYLWKQTDGLSVTLSDTGSATAKATFVAPPVNDDDSDGMIQLTFQLTVTDNRGLQASDEVVITITDNGITTVFPDPNNVITTKTTTNEDIGLKVYDDKGSVIKGGIISLDTIDPNTIAEVINRPNDMPYGLINMGVKVPAFGDTVQVVIYLPAPAPEGYGWFKYSTTQGRYDFSSYAEFNDDRTQVTLTLTDGGSGDDDGVADGVIIDSSGLGNLVPAQQRSRSGGGGGGCFIATLLRQ